MALFDTLKEVLTPYAAKILKLEKEKNLLDYRSKRDLVHTHNGITYTWSNDLYSCHITGTATATAFYAIFRYSDVPAGADTMLAGLRPGDPILVQAVGSDENVTLELFFYDANNNALKNYKSPFKSTHGYYIVIPENASKMLIRIAVAKDSVVDCYMNNIRVVKADLYRNFVLPKRTLPFGTDLDSDIDPGIYMVSAGGTYENLPSGVTYGILLCASAFNQYSFKMLVSKSGVYFKYLTNDWITNSLASYNITNEITQDTYDNTYNISCSPNITSDDHNWLESTGDSTDRTSDIVVMLTQTGYCHLGEGVFYVSGNIDMPVDSSLIGCGNKTVVKFIDSVGSGYVLKPNEGCTIKDICFVGGDTPPANILDPTASSGSRRCVYLSGNIAKPFKMHNCNFYRFNGPAIYMNDNGGSSKGYAIVSDCYIENCMVGIELFYKSEYNKFSNVITRDCNTACINNGGNNTFVGCTFHGVKGFIIDNSDGTKTNNGHGSVIGCIFNHINNANNVEQHGMGDGIILKGVTPGFIFDGCQMWYSAIRIENSVGVQFSNCLIGGNTPVISLIGDKPTFFNGCIFHATPSISANNTGSKFIECYLDSDGTKITAS